MVMKLDEANPFKEIEWKKLLPDDTETRSKILRLIVCKTFKAEQMTQAFKKMWKMREESAISIRHT